MTNNIRKLEDVKESDRVTVYVARRFRAFGYNDLPQFLLPDGRWSKATNEAAVFVLDEMEGQEVAYLLRQCVFNPSREYEYYVKEAD